MSLKDNWKKIVVGCGCLMGAACIGIAVLFFVIFSSMKSSTAYKEGIAKAKSHAQVIATLGEPIEEATFMSGNINVSAGVTDVDIAIDLSGPKGSGSLKITASCKAEQCTYSELSLSNTEKGTINILSK